MLLGRGAVFAFDDHIRLGKSGLDIPLADAVMAEDVRIAVGVDAG